MFVVRWPAVAKSTPRFSFKKSLRRPSYWFVGVCLIPSVIAIAHAVVDMLPPLGRGGLIAWGCYAAGIVAYLILEKLVMKPMWLYVFGHEMTHVVSGLLSGARIHSFRVGSRGGEVRLSKSNAFIALSPYVFPFYVLLLLGVYALAHRWWNPPALQPVFEVLMGAGLAFHVSLTMSAFHHHQPDLKMLGHFLSAVLIILGNLLVVALLLIGLFPHTPTLRHFVVRSTHETFVMWKQSASWVHRTSQEVIRHRKEVGIWTR